MQAGVAASFLPLSSRTWGSRYTGGKPKKLHRLLVDRTIPESVRLGTFADLLADEIIEFDGDLTRLWQDELRMQWPGGPRTIGGLTRPSVLMVLEQLGRDHGARIIFSAEHQNRGSGIQHELMGCSKLLDNPEFSSGHDWVADMARYIAASPMQTPARKASTRYTTRGQTGLSQDQSRLVTWVMAPVLSNKQRPNPEIVS